MITLITLLVVIAETRSKGFKAKNIAFIALAILADYLIYKTN